MFLHIWFPLIFCSVKIIVFPEVGPSSIYLKILPPRVACTWLFVLWCNLKWFHQVSQQQCEMGKKICTHWTDGEAMWLWLEPWFTAQYGDTSLRPHCQTATISGALLRQYCFKQRDFKHSVNNFLSSPPLPPPPPNNFIYLQLVQLSWETKNDESANGLTSATWRKVFEGFSVMSDTPGLTQEAPLWSSWQKSSWCPLQSLFYDV